MKIQLLLGAVVLALVLISTEGRSFPRRGGGRHHGHEAGRGSRRRIQRICTQAPESGVCFARRQMWFYNATSETCETFIYGGCGGNGNRFYTQEGCMRRCSDPCTRPLDEGDECTRDSEPDATIRYYYDSEDNSCKEFEYSGCGGNTNRFRSLGYCERRCVEDSESSSDDELFDSDLFDSESDDDEDSFEESSDSVDRRNRRSHSRHLRIPRPRCQAAMCRLQCLYGQEVYTDGNGCIKCRCKQPRCPEVQRCAIVCEHGHVIDPTTGCETCACKDADSADDDDDTDVDQLPEHCIGRPMCLMYCHYGFQKGQDGCPICACNAPPTNVEEIPKHCLGRIMCAMHCEHGFQRGDDGCPICRCNPAPVALEVAAAAGGDGREPTARMIRPNRCLPVMCRLGCRYGFQRGEDGCQQCSCNPAPTPRPLPDECPRFMCTMACEHGFQTDERGCAKCRCNRPPRPTPYPEICRNRPMCKMACPNGFETGDDGCPICRCKPFVPTQPDKCARRPMCLMWCEHGFQIGRDGCEICRCNYPRRIEAAAAFGTDSLTQPLHTPQEGEEEEEEEEIVRVIRRRRCSRFRCRRRCEFGFQKDEFGCDKCKCVCNRGPRVEFPEQCADRPACYRRCPNGFEIDDEGCPLCRCKREEATPTLQNPETCPTVYCLIPCLHGSIPDENGCETCNCLPSPTSKPVACPSIYCLIPCLYGSIPDENGCETCNCLPAPTSTPPAPTSTRSPEEPECPVQLKCFAPCPGGYKRDRNGCETCECLQPEVICSYQCRKRCPHGYKRDENGCETCECRTEECPLVRCPMIFNCPFGYQLDAQGCQTCQCRGFNPTPQVSGEEASAVRGVVHAAAGVVHAAAAVGGTGSTEGDVCSQPLKIGPCFGAIPRFYYNGSTKKCEMFRYGGCLGNGNNFRSAEACRERCEMS